MATQGNPKIMHMESPTNGEMQQEKDYTTVFYFHCVDCTKMARVKTKKDFL
jgi:hypothetical protein